MPPSPTAQRTVTVGLGPRSYDVLIGAGTLPTLGQRVAVVFGHDAPVRRVLPRRAFVVRDAGLPEMHAAAAITSLREAGYQVSTFDLNPSEATKTLVTAQAILAAMARSRHERTDPVIALGGGVVGDVAGFAAAIYRRGVPIVQCPTTLLAMVDSSVGGKTGVNLEVAGEDSDKAGEGGLLKNLVGAFHQPALVLCDVTLLASLPLEELRCGLAECIKHGLIAGDWRDPDLLTWTRASLPPLLDRDPAHLIELVARNVAVKARVVESDERETGDGPGGGRLALNAGHTVGHAIETLDLPGGPLRHGQAVAIGLVAESLTGERLGITLRGATDRLRDTLAAAGLPTSATGLPPAPVILDRMRDDKKTAGGRMRLPLPTGDGRCRVVIDPPETAVLAGLEGVGAPPASP